MRVADSYVYEDTKSYDPKNQISLHSKKVHPEEMKR